MPRVNQRSFASRTIYSRERAAQEQRATRFRPQVESRELFSPRGIVASANISKLNSAMRLAENRGMNLPEAIGRLTQRNDHFRGAMDWAREQFEQHLHNLSQEEKQYIEHLKMQKEYMEVSEQEQLVHQMQALKMEREELIKQSKMVTQLTKILEERNIPRAQAVLIAKEMVVAIRGLLHQEALSRENYNRLINDENLLLQIASASSHQLNSKEIINEMKAGGLKRVDIVSDITQKVLQQHKMVEGEE